MCLHLVADGGLSLALLLVSVGGVLRRRLVALVHIPQIVVGSG